MPENGRDLNRCPGLSGGAFVLGETANPRCRSRSRTRWYQESYRKLLGLAAHLIEAGRNLAPMNEIVDGLTETEAKGLLKVLIASEGND